MYKRIHRREAQDRCPRLRKIWHIQEAYDKAKHAGEDHFPFMPPLRGRLDKSRTKSQRELYPEIHIAGFGSDNREG